MLLFFGQAQQRNFRQRIERLEDFNAAVAGGTEGKTFHESLVKAASKED